MATVIDSVTPSTLVIPRDDCVEVTIVAHNTDGHDPVSGTATFLVGDQQVTVEVTLEGAATSPVTFGNVVLSPDLVQAGVTYENHGNGVYLICGPEYDPAEHAH
jgi:hypothetical protein